MDQKSSSSSSNYEDHTERLQNSSIPRTVVVLPAGGTGERFGDALPKQFVKVCDRSLYLWTVDVFHPLPWVQEIYLVVNEHRFSEMEKELKSDPSGAKVVLVKGCSTRHRSIQAGVIEAYRRAGVTKAEVVIIHDVVRPVVSPELCEAVARNAQEFGACGPVRKLVSTILTVDSNGFMQEALPRAKLRASEMPQAFCLEMIHKSYCGITEEELDHGTECLLLAQKYNDNCRVKILEWHEDLFKVTYRRDLIAVKGLIEEKILCANDNS